jgi:hypothetical protein
MSKAQRKFFLAEERQIIRQLPRAADERHRAIGIWRYSLEVDHKR